MKLPTTTAKIRQLSHEGRGIAEINGKTIFIQNALPDETVAFQTIKQHKNFEEGIANAVLENPHSDRIKPLCPHTAICAGCSLQHLSAQGQLALKERTLKEQFKHFAHLDLPPLEAAIHDSAYYYRHKARLSVKDVLKKNKVLIGFHEHNGRYVADIEHCAILAKPVGNKLPLLTQLISTLDARSKIPQIEVAITVDETALIIRHVIPLNQNDLEKIIAFASKESFSIYLQPSKQDHETEQTVTALLGMNVPGDHSTALIKLWPKNSPFLLHYRLATQACTLYFSPTEFTQINPTINQLMVTQALSWLAPTQEDRVLDLFCGIGNFTLPLAHRARSVIGVEGSDSMVKRAQYNAHYNGLHNTTFLATDLNNSITHLALLNTTFDKILIDPPRSGALEVIEQHFKDWQPKSIVYISCNPATLARDAGILVHKLGYRLERIGILDMFPQTSHVESMALFTREG